MSRELKFDSVLGFVILGEQKFSPPAKKRSPYVRNDACGWVTRDQVAQYVVSVHSLGPARVNLERDAFERA